MSANISGFPEFLPKEQIAFNRVIEKIKQQFELYGFIPLDTPAVEKASTLLAKGNDNEIYGIYRLAGADSATSKKDLALRFDLTVPLARYVAQNYGSITFPYKRYHIAPVWRGERPQAGRSRQFYQADIDIIGDGELSLIHDAEVLAIIYHVFQAIEIPRYVIKINNRYILTGLLQSFGVIASNIAAVMRCIDKAEKISQAILITELASYGLSQEQIGIIINLAEKRLANADWLAYLRTICTTAEFLHGVDELEVVLNNALLFGLDNNFVQIDPSLARGLNYYTGTVFETKLLDYPELGSVCGGGRYANLAETFTKKKLPGVGISIGITRLITKLIDLGIITAGLESTARVLVTTQNKDCMPQYIQIARELRVANINTEIYLADKLLATQMKYASKKAFRFVIIADVAELEANNVILRDMLKGEQSLVARVDLPKYL